ncbi:hypothetical protein PANO111632_05670 [Paracoccus nototheniae]|uniref:PhiE125 gp8 family phage protein n=1 Tax=Paracoccus nototheniae TaxID=2489002 RepID=A0ABW4E1G3_9RHOB|nr:hypothetical protein [Paracoccus nototheniae]
MIVQRLDRTPWLLEDLQDLRDHARVDPNGYDDVALRRMFVAAVLEAEEHGQLALFPQTVRVTLDAWPRGHTFRLPIGPLLDWDSVSTTADGQPFEDFNTMTGQWPVLRLTGARPCGQVVIEYASGCEYQSHKIPTDLAHALMDQALAYYDARGPGDPKAQALSPHFARIVGRYRGVRI